MKASISNWRQGLRTLTFALAIVSCAGTVLAQASLTPDKPLAGEAPSLLRSAPARQLAADPAMAKALKTAGTLRERAVDIDFAILQGVRNGMMAADQPQALRIAFFDDAPLLVEITAIKPTASGGHGYLGRVPGIAQSLVVMVDNDGAVSINVSALSRKYVIQGTAQSGYVSRELVEQERPDHGNPVPEINAPPLPRKSAGSSSSAEPPEVAADTGNEIDVMVVYTPVGRASHGGTAQINAAIDAQILLVNQVYLNSNVVQRLRLVYKGEVNHTESASSSTDLGRLANTGDGFLDEVPVLRNIYQADVVSLWGNYPDTCGIGYLMATESSGFAGNAYNIVNSPACSAGNSYTYAHELGHNMGLRHDNYVDLTPNTTVTLEGSGTSTSINYAHGYVDLTNRFRTVMSYNDQCVAGGFNCTRIPNFSNPSVNFNNNGSYAPAVSATTGNASNAHERLALNSTRDTVANFRQGLATLTGPGIVMFLPPSYSVVEGGGTVTLTVARHVGSFGAISVSYSTSNITATAGSDYTAVSNTLTWANGDATPKTITVNISQDAVLEGNETFSVTLSNPAGGVSIGTSGGTSSSATISIVDDESDPALGNCAFQAGFTGPAGFSTPATATAGWSVATDRLRSGACSLKSNAIADNGMAQTQVTGTFTGGAISFYYNVSSEANYDCLRFLVDGVERAEMGACSNSGGFGASGAVAAWTLVSVPVSAGFHTFVWSYEKDGSIASGSDAAWIDDVVLPPQSTVMLTIAKAGTGAGTVTGSGITCGGVCSVAVTPGTMVALSAGASAGSTFTGWSGGGCSGTAACTVTVNAATTVTATFTLQPLTLSVLLAGTGTGNITSSPAGIDTGLGDYSEAYLAGTVVTLTAAAQGSATFAGWSGGGCGGTGTCVVTVNAVTTVTATFNIVLTTPGAPTIGAGSPGDGQAAINFSAPASDGGTAITGYTATCTNGPSFTGSGAFSPITVTGLSNTVNYSCSVTASNSVGTGPASGTVSVTPSAVAQLVLVGAQSRKMHAGLGPFNVPIAIGVPIGGAVSVEPRTSGAGHSIAFLFNGTVTSAGSASVTPVGSAAISGFSGSEVSVTLTGVPDNNRVTVTLTGVNGVATASVALGFLVGDINGSRSVNARDIAAVKTNQGAAVSQSTARFDLNASGVINGQDVSAVKARSPLALP